MRIVLDHCVPRRFGKLLVGHDARTARLLGFDRLANGSLLNAAQVAGLEVLVTVDQNLRYEQNLQHRLISVIVLVAVDNRLPTLSPYAPAVLQVLTNLPPGSLVLIDGEGNITYVIGPEPER